MATELIQFLTEQLQTLPKGHHDRHFLEGQKLQAEKYAAHLKSGPDSFIELKKGPYVEIDDLIKITHDTSRSETERRHARSMAACIQVDGNDSIAHLCLPTIRFHSLLRANINTITDIRNALAEGSLLTVRHFGLEDLAITQARLTLFDQQLQASKQEPPQT